ncbi:uncharacterized protein LOC129765449 isoform X2 [Toxorhynchites rutilus septentrionalis]|nr:uncharacterized protein LOC129765449 isoform X2 [Toxorhynchites rutilus septentrionalis]XP_055621761.1 uncharacterized protein LOC129765449 isoform X2 [Toxorhynchites rutilus septentrionalis]
MNSPALQEITDDYLEKISLPDPDNICDCCNEFIYLQLTKEKAEYLNSYDSDFEEDINEIYTEASNTTVALKFPGDYVHFLLYGYYQKGSKDNHKVCDHDEGFDDLENTALTNDGVDTRKPCEDEPKQTKLSYLIEELLITERNYINTLELGITTYITNVFSESTLPPELLNMKYHIFGNIEYIHQFHQSILLPKLIACGKDAVRIADVFCRHIENDSFYGYVLYSLYHPKSQRLYVKFSGFFEKHQNTSGDKLGVKSFFLQPIQRLPRYKLILDSIAKSLLSDNQPDDHDIQTKLQLVCRAGDAMQNFINTMNECMAVNDIAECEKTEDEEVEMGFGVLKPVNVLIGQNSENQTLFLYPRSDDNQERSKPINILHQGKFRKVFPMFINDIRQRRQYQGKLFVFERCVIYTEQTRPKALTYRGHFDHLEIAYDFSNQQILKIFSENDKHHGVEAKINIQNPDAANLAVLADLLHSIIGKRSRKEGYFIESSEIMALRKADSKRSNSYRSSLSSNASSFSYNNTCVLDTVEIPLDATPFQEVDHNDNYNLTSLDQIVNFHQYYEKALRDGVTFYICSLPCDMREQLTEFYDILKELMSFQNNINCQLFENDESESFRSELDHLCDIFHDSLKRSEFEVYLRYVERSKSAELILMSFEQYFTGQPREDDTICLSIDSFLSLPIVYINKCYHFFNDVWEDVNGCREEVILRNTVLDYKINYIHSQLSLLRQRVNENFYIRQFIMDVAFLGEIGLVQYSEIVKIEGSFATYRLFLFKTGLLCMKINSEKPDEPETYNMVTFYCPYTKSTAKMSRRDEKGWSIYLDGSKTTLLFDNKQARSVVNDRYTKLADQMRATTRVKKRTFFRAPD